MRVRGDNVGAVNRFDTGVHHAAPKCLRRIEQRLQWPVSPYGCDRVAGRVCETLADLLEGLVGDELAGLGQIVHHHLHRAIDLKSADSDERQYQQNQEYGCEFSAKVHCQTLRQCRS